MLKNFFKVALRNIRRNAIYSFINISGLSVGIACTILILLWVKSETSFDTFIPKADRLHQVWVNAELEGEVQAWNSVPLPTYEAMKTAHAKITNSCVTGWGGSRLLTVDDIRLMKEGYYVSEEFLDMFEYEMLVGDGSLVLDDPSSIVISTQVAQALFGHLNPVGEFIKVNDQSILKVTGVFKDIPDNSTFQFDYLIPWKHREATESWLANNKTNWDNYSFQVFVELANEEDELEVEASIKDILNDRSEMDIPKEFFLHPMLRWRLHTSFEKGNETGGQHEYITMFSLIALVILVIACINFMNLATARAEGRAKEVGVRKSLGSRRVYLILQFYGESILISILSFVFAIILVLAALPAYNQLVNKQLAIDFSSTEFWLFSLLVIALTGVVSGSYPSLYLSSFDPIKTLKGKVSIGKHANLPRKILVVLQFGFAVILIICTIVITRQIDIAKSRDLGYSQEGLISIPLTEEMDENYDIIEQELKRSGQVISMTRANSNVTQINSNNFLDWPGKPASQKVIFVTITSAYDYAKTVGAKMLYGRDFSKEYATDSSAIIINKAALDLMQLGSDPIGTQLELWEEKRTLIGVIDNILMGSPYEEVRPMFMILDNWGGSVMVRLKPTKDMQATMGEVRSIFEKYNSAYPFDYSFTDVDFEKKYTSINLTRQLSTLFALLSVFITGLGLFGLASFLAEQRVKEIGIRKVLGASVPNLVGLMSKDFAKLVFIAFCIAAPLAYLLMDGYLQRYTIRATLDWWIFALTGGIALLFTLLVVVNQARRAALANPATSLRSE